MAVPDSASGPPMGARSPHCARTPLCCPYCPEPAWPRTRHNPGDAGTLLGIQVRALVTSQPWEHQHPPRDTSIPRGPGTATGHWHNAAHPGVGTGDTTTTHLTPGTPAPCWGPGTALGKLALFLVTLAQPLGTLATPLRTPTQPPPGSGTVLGKLAQSLEMLAQSLGTQAHCRGQ